MHVRVHLSDIVEVSMRCCLLLPQFLRLPQEGVEGELGLEVTETTEGEGLGRTINHDLMPDVVEVGTEFME